MKNYFNNLMLGFLIFTAIASMIIGLNQISGVKADNFVFVIIWFVSNAYSFSRP